MASGGIEGRSLETGTLLPWPIQALFSRVAGWWSVMGVQRVCDESGVKGPAQAMVQLFQNENEVGPPVDLYAETPAKSGRLRLGELELPEGKNNLMFKLVGKNEKSAGLGLDLIQVICVRVQ